MLLVLSAALSLALWVLLWGLDMKALDAFLISLLLMVLAAVAYIVVPYLPGNRAAAEPDPDPAPFS